MEDLNLESCLQSGSHPGCSAPCISAFTEGMHQVPAFSLATIQESPKGGNTAVSHPRGTCREVGYFSNSGHLQQLHQTNQPKNCLLSGKSESKWGEDPCLGSGGWGKEGLLCYVGRAYSQKCIQNPPLIWALQFCFSLPPFSFTVSDQRPVLMTKPIFICFVLAWELVGSD